MPRWLLLGVAALTGCTDWPSLYAPSKKDAGAIAPRGVDAAQFLDAPVDLPEDTADTQGPMDVVPRSDGEPCPESDSPVVVWRFEINGKPSVTHYVSDFACRAPDVPLGWTDRSARNTHVLDGVLYFDGGYLLADPPASRELGNKLLKMGSFSIEMWLRPANRTQSATILGTRVDRDPGGRAFAIAQRDNMIHFAVHTSATDPMGVRLNTGQPAEISAPLPMDTPTPVHVVALYSGGEKAAHLYVNGKLEGTVPHARPGGPEPKLEWTDRNELGLGGSYEGISWYGALYWVAIYDRPLSALEIADLFAIGTVP